MDFTSFHLITEAKMFKLPSFYTEQIHKLAYNFYRNFLHNKNTRDREIAVKIKTNKKIFLGTILLQQQDRYIPKKMAINGEMVPNTRKKIKESIGVYIKLLPEDFGGVFDHDNYVININKNKILSMSELDIYELLVHEITHTIKQNIFDKNSKKYERAINNMTKHSSYNKAHYYLEPAELEAQTTGLYHYVVKKFNDLKNLYAYTMRSEQQWDKISINYINELNKFIKTPIQFYIDNPNQFPASLAKFKTLIETIATDRYQWMKFKNKMINIVKDLSEQKQT